MADRAGESGSTLRVVIVAPSLDGTDVGEVYSAFQMVEALSHEVELTVLATSREGAKPLAEQLPEAEVVTWPEIGLLYKNFERLNAQAKPALPLFGMQLRRWLRRAQSQGRKFDIIHQILPQAMRHTALPYGTGIPYIVGPLAGGLTTPEGFAGEMGKESAAVRLRGLDEVRLKHDPILRASYRNAALIMGVAPYVQDRLKPIGEFNFKISLERGHGELPPPTVRQASDTQVRLVHVGRTVRTKGLRDVIRAMAHLQDLPGVTLTSVGDGADMNACKNEAQQLGVADRITFMGRIPREAVEKQYAEADIFCFPSFREPMGGVFFEAMAHGLPIITAARGGPDFIVDETCGLRLPVETPEQFARDIAKAIRALTVDPQKRLDLGAGARERLLSFGTWKDKAAGLVDTYRQVVSAAGN